MEEFESLAEDYFERREKSAKNSRNRQLISKAELERSAFSSSGIFQSGAGALRKKLAATRSAMQNVYEVALAAYHGENANDEIAIVEDEFEAYKGRR